MYEQNYCKFKIVPNLNLCIADFLSFKSIPMRIFYSCLLFALVTLSNGLQASTIPQINTPLATTMGCNAPDSLQLLRLYNTTSGAGWINKWDLTKPMSTWYGVTLTADGCNVVALNLDNNNLMGKLPKLALPNVLHVGLSRNVLTDTIPNFNTPNLKFLDVSQNQLSGNVPEFSFFKPDTLSIENNNFVFGDIVGKSWLNARDIIYAPQAKIPIGIRNDSLFVSTGVADKDQQFNWFKDNVYVGTFTSSAFKPTVSGMYYCLLTHKTLTIQNNIDKNLVLQSQEYTIRISKGKRIIPLDLPNCLEDDFNQLEALYDSTGGKNWINQSNWFTADMNKWFGVRLTADGCDVAQINLPNNNLVGIITNYNLPDLSNLDFSSNSLNGSNGSNGSIPNFAQSPKLKVLSLQNNKFTGSLPSFDFLSRLVNLNVANNQLSGTLPDVSALINLETCNLDSNKFSGSIKNLTQLGSLKDLRVIQNKFSGDVPEFTSQDLQYLALEKNKFVFADFFGKDWWKKSSCLDGNCNVSTYAPQANIAISTLGDSLSVLTGSPDAEQIFNWYRNGVLFTTTATSKYKPTVPGIFYCAISHKTLTITTDPTDTKRNLVLKSDSFVVKTSNAGRALPITLPACLINAFNQLEKLYDATAGNNWSLNTHWFTDSNLNHWSGIVLTTDGCSVDSIKLSANNLSGTLPNLNLPNVRALILNDNALSGNLPATDSLPRLIDFNAANNQFSGAVPTFSKSQNLVSIRLSKNQLSGNIPNFVLPQLKTLQLTSNALTGALPDFKLDSLRTLNVDSNKLSGNLPNLAQSTKLQSINVSSNQFFGNVPDFATTQNLASINIANNKFIFGDMVGKQWLCTDVLCNVFSAYAPQAKIPINLSNDGTLSVLTGAADADQIFKWFKDGVLIATTQSSKFKTQSTGVYSCRITHSILTVANNLLRNLVLQSTDTAIRVSNGGRIFPKGLRACLEDDFNQLEALYDSTNGKNWTKNSNWLTDPSLTNWYGIQLTADSCDVVQINLNNNNLGGNLGGNLPNFNLPQLEQLALSSNKLSGSIPNFNLPNVISINFGANALSGDIPNFAQSPDISVINLSGNRLSGSIPNFVLSQELITLDLNNNRLSGKIPDFSKNTKLIDIDLSHNKLSGSIPSFVSNTDLLALSLNNNQLSGNIPDFAQSVSLITINLSNNQLSGILPNFGSLLYLQSFDCSSNQISGNIPNYVENTQFKVIRLNNNQLIGNIPSFNTLTHLLSLDCSYNQLSGSIPDFRNSPPLGDLLVDNNKFIFGDLAGKRWLKDTNIYVSYAPQAKIPVTLSSDGMLSVSTGTPDADQQFKWFFIAPNTTTPTLVATTNSSQYRPTATGAFYCQVTHTVLTVPTDSTRNLILVSDNYNVGVSNGGRILPSGLKACLFDAFNALEALYDSTGGKTWTNSRQWLSNPDLSQWFGVVLTSDGCNIAALRLGNNNLIQRLPNIHLSALTHLDVSKNKLTGTIPDLSLPNLETLLLNNNSFNGAVPNLANCPVIATLDLSFNLLTDAIPDFNFPHLTTLFLNDNALSGALPNLVGSTPLSAFHLQNNQFIFGDLVGKQWLCTDITCTVSSVYAPQATIPIVLRTDGYLSVFTGATDSDQIFNWYRSGALVATTQSSTFKPQSSGVYSCQITHNTITIPSDGNRNLILQSSSLALRVSAGGRILPSRLAVCLEDDFNALEALYDSTSGNNWSNKTHWLTDGDLKTWFGVVLTDDGCDVAELKLPNNNLSGTLPAFNLPKLLNLDLSNNTISGIIPNLNLTAVKNINLNTNLFTGGVPNLNIPHIVTLDLGSNKLSGTIPASLTFPALLNLYLNNNQLTGAIPNLNIPTLTSLQLSNNSLSGTIPNFVFPNLTNLQLNNNQLSGTIPNFDFPNLTNLYLYQNKLSGAIPNFAFPKLLNLFLNNNQLSGAIPTFAQSIPLSALSVDNNAFIFGDMLAKPWLTVSNVRYAFQAKIPIAFNNGVFSVQTGAIDNDQTFNWYRNSLLVATTPGSKYKPTISGTYSCQITHKTLTVPTDYFKNFVLQSADSAVRLSNGGRIIPRSLPDCAVITYNQLEALYDSTGGKNWTNNSNWLTTGNLSDWYGVNATSDNCDISILSLGSNNLVGTLPNLVLNNLIVFDVGGNNLAGAVPNFAFPNLIVVNFGYNKFSGALSNFNCPQLKGLLISNNQLSGSIPNFSMPNLKVLDVSFNKLTGSIPNFNLKFLTDLIFQSNQLTGSIPNYNLRLLKTIDVRDNLLSGDIPSFSALPSLAVLYVQNNAFIFGDIVGKPWLNTTTLAYNPQANIPLVLDANAGMLKVFTGAADGDQIFKWYVNGVLEATNSTSTYKPISTGAYSCQITHNTLTIPTDNSKNLILKTGGVAIRISKGGRIFPTGLAVCLEDDFNQLEALYDSTGGTNWIKKTNWFTSVDLKTWYGISLTADGCDVAKIFLGSNNLAGRLPNINLPLLINLDVSSNQLSGNMPDLASTAQLTTLNVSGNIFSGSIPDFKLPKLNTLDVSFNQLASSVPNFAVSIQLSSLSIQNNQFIFGDILNKPWLGILNVSYSPQANIPLTLNSDGTISVFTGALNADQTFRWYNNGVLVATTAVRKYLPQQTGVYTCQVTHRTLTVTTVSAKNLVLQSTPLALRISNGGRIFPTGLAACLEDDYNQLEALYDSTGGANWLKNTNWLINADLKTWFGVALTTNNGCDVYTLNLSQNNLVGKIPNIKLPNLISLDAGYNKLTGVIPDFSAAQNLVSLKLNNNSLTGTVPNFNLPNLQILDVSFNGMSGNIPDVAASNQLSAVRLNNNNLTGSIPNFNLQKLNVLDVSFNQLSSSVPDFTMSSQLSAIGLNNNGFIFGDLAAKRWLCTDGACNVSTTYAPQAKIPTSLSTDGILSVSTGTPDGDQIFRWFKDGVEIPNSNSSKLKPQSAGIYYCLATHNALTVVSDAKKNLILQSQDAIIRFSPGGRLLPVNLPTCLEYNFKQLEILYDSTAGKTWTNSANWFTSGDMSKWYGIILTPDSCDVVQINLSHNNLEGALTNYVLRFTRLKVFDVSTNNLTGQIPNLTFSSALSTLSLNDNNLTGTIPEFDSSPALVSLDLGYNNLTGTIPKFDSNPALVNLDLGYNQLSGSIPDFMHSAKLKAINVGGNQLSGTIPSFKLPDLTYLQLNDNKFTNGIPSFSNAPQLLTINLANNTLTNGIPSFSLPNLQTLMLNNNQLSSNIPNFNLPNLTAFNVSTNQLSGAVPAFNLCPKLLVLSIDNNGFVFGDIANKPWLRCDTSCVTCLPCSVSATYAPQARIGINFFKDSLRVSTGEPDSVQQFKWFKDGVLVAITQSSKYVPLLNGIYNCQISHNTLTVVTDMNRNLVLQTENFEVSIFAVNFFSFTGKKGDTFNLLDWQTSVEVILDSFVIERSNDSINFVPLGALKGAGNSSTPAAYQFKDIAPLVGNNYYRIKAKDNTGKFIYSNIIVIPFFTPTVDLQNDDILTVYPNPAEDYLNVNYEVSGSTRTNINYQITNVAGQVVQFGHLKNGYPLRLAGLAQGIYFLHAGNKVVRFVKA